MVLSLENEGGAATTAASAHIPVGRINLLFSGDPAAAPVGPDYDLSLRKVNPLAPGQVNSLALAVEWGMPPGVASMAAIVHTPGVEVTLSSGRGQRHGR